MANIKTASVNLSLSVTEELESAPAARGSVLSNLFDVGQRALSPTSTPAVSKYTGWQPALAAGTLDIDLTALPGTQGTFSGATKKIIAFRLLNPNANTVTIEAGSSNGYLLLGASGKVIVPAGTTADPAEFAFYLRSGGVTIDATHKILTLTGTGTDAFKVEVLLG